MKKSIAIIIGVLLFYGVFVWDTNNIISDFKKCICYGKTTNSALDRYIVKDISKENIKIKIHRKFVMHNFRKGVVYVTYSYQIYDNNREIVKGAWDISATWFIEREDGRWKVKKIIEKP